MIRLPSSASDSATDSSAVFSMPREAERRSDEPITCDTQATAGMTTTAISASRQSW